MKENQPLFEMCETRPASWGSNNADIDNQLGATALKGVNMKISKQ